MAGLIPQSFIDDLLNRTDIVEVVSSRIQLKKTGKNYSACCPFHKEKTPSFTVSPDKQFYYCFGCGAGGNALGFVMDHDQLEFPQAVEELAKRAGMDVPREERGGRGHTPRQPTDSPLYPLLSAAAEFYKQALKSHPARKAAVNYLKGRGLTGEIARDFGLGFAPPGWDNLLKHLGGDNLQLKAMLDAGLLVENSDTGKRYDRFRDRVMFPIRDSRGRIIAFGGRVLDDSKPKYVNSPETLVYHKSDTVFALQIAKRSASHRYVLCEGYMDVISMHQAGIDTAVCACGTALTPDQIKLISQYADEVILSYDSDEAGQKATLRSLELFRNSPVRVGVLQIPGAKDPDEYIKKYGADRFKALLDGVGNALDFRLGRLRSQYDLKQDAQRLEYVKEAVEMLAQRSNPTEQEVYAGRLAEETNISKTAIMAQLADAVKKAGSKRRREQDRARLQEGEMNQIKVPYGAGRGALGMASAEQRLLAAMLREPGYVDKVSAQLRPEQFLQPQQKELYEAMLRCREQGVEVSLATLRAFVSEEALNELSRLAAQYSDVNCTPEDIKLYLERIARGTPVASRAASMSTNDIEQYLQSMREQKQGTADAEDSV